MTTDEPAVIRELESLYAAVEGALQRGELDVLEGLLTADFRAVGDDGEAVGRADVIGHFKQMMDGLVEIRWPRRVTRVERRGEEVVATVEGRFTGRPAGGEPVTAETRAEDTWIATPSGWKNKAARSLATGSHGG